jgi:hypothetical protein
MKPSTPALHRNRPATANPDRRLCPDRRANWRGGRREIDWTNRPIGAVLQFKPAPQRAPRWWQWFSSERHIATRRDD